MLPAPPTASPADHASTALPGGLCLTGTDAEVAAHLARRINAGWRFGALPVRVLPGMWLVQVTHPGEVGVDPIGW